MTYSVGEEVEARRPSKGWESAEVIEDPGTLAIRVAFADGKRLWRGQSEIRKPRTSRTPPIRHVETSDEAESWESRRSVGAVLSPVPKPKKPTRSTSHLDHVRSLPCCVSGSTQQVVAHHVENGGMGRKCSDLLTVPLTDELHAYYHQHGHLPGLDRVGTMAVFWESIGRTLAARMEDA